MGGFLVVCERLGALLMLAALVPLLLAVTAAVRIDSEGPALFRQPRIGQYGRGFLILKFRTMRQGADAELQALVEQRGMELGAYVKVEDDPRITKLGALLRRTSVDELPQLWNVVRGDMSLVGPRPQTPAEIATYEPQDWRRLLVRPGITGLWQVSGRSELSASEALDLDTRYVKEWSPLLDIWVLVRTFGVVLSRRGAH